MWLYMVIEMVLDEDGQSVQRCVRVTFFEVLPPVPYSAFERMLLSDVDANNECERNDSIICDVAQSWSRSHVQSQPSFILPQSHKHTW